MTALQWIYKISTRIKNHVWDFFDAFIDDQMYIPSTSHIVKKYIEYNVRDIKDFAAMYTFEHHERKGTLDNKKSKAKMYYEVHRIMAMLEEKGSLDK